MIICALHQGFSNYGSQPQMGSRNVILGPRNKLDWQIRYKCFCKLMWRLHVSSTLDYPSRSRLEKPFLKWVAEQKSLRSPALDKRTFFSLWCYDASVLVVLGFLNVLNVVIDSNLSFVTKICCFIATARSSTASTNLTIPVQYMPKHKICWLSYNQHHERSAYYKFFVRLLRSKYSVHDRQTLMKCK